MPDRMCKLDGLVSVLQDVDTLDQCRQLCRDEDSCKYITHFGPESSLSRGHASSFTVAMSFLTVKTVQRKTDNVLIAAAH